MKREPRTEVVSVRLTASERARLDKLGGATAVIRRALDHQHCTQPVEVTLTGVGVGTSLRSVVWNDGVVGQSWPAYP